MNPASSRAAVRSMATLTHAARAANPAARSALSVAARSPVFASRALSSNSRQFGQFPRLQLINNNKRAFSTTVNMVRKAAHSTAIGTTFTDAQNLVYCFPH
jgi:fumarate hydratase class II